MWDRMSSVVLTSDDDEYEPERGSRLKQISVPVLA